jgi:hypothetical protein
MKQSKKQEVVEFKAGTVIEVSFARINEGKEGQLFGEYFPKVMPILMELSGKSLGSFSIVDSKGKLNQPQMCALFQWPSLEAFNKLHADERFLSLKKIRDDALEYLSNGHFFTVLQDTKVTFIDGELYSLNTNNGALAVGDALLNLNLLQHAQGNYQLDKISISNWDNRDSDALSSEENHIDVYKISRNF